MFAFTKCSSELTDCSLSCVRFSYVDSYEEEEHQDINCNQAHIGNIENVNTNQNGSRSPEEGSQSHSYP